jgi:Tfp pilus assembly protein PilO
MSLKILMIPFSILMILVLGIGFIKPDYTTMSEKKALYATKLAEQENVRMLMGNIDTLTHSLDSEKEAEDFLQYYIPKDTDQDRVIDMLNFLAAQSGVLTDVISITPVEEDAEALAAEQAALTPDPNAIDPLTGAPIVVLPPYTVKTRSFSADVTVKGKYENIKEFLGRVAHMNRLHKTREFSISTGENNNSETESSDVLTGKFRADFDYLVPRPVESATNVPVFSRGSFTLASLKTLSEWVTNRVPLLEKPSTGRTNPFQQ